MFRNISDYYFLIGVVVLLFFSCNNVKNINNADQKPDTTSGTKTTKKLPNIVIIVADDLGWNDVGFHGSDIKTSNIDNIVKKSAEFNRFYAYHSCTPTRVGLMTGKFPGRLGLNHVLYPQRKGGVPESEVTLAEYLDNYGYNRRACIGKWHLGHSSIKYHPLNQGFTYFYGCYGGLVDYFTHKNANELDWHKNFETCNDQGYATDLITKEAVKFINDTEKNEPFFLYVPYNAPHSPLQAPEEYLNMYDFDKTKPIYSDINVLPSDKLLPYQIGQGNTKRQTYAAMVTAMDIGIGKIYKTLEEKKLLDNTFFLFVSDNGGTPYYGGSNLPFDGKKGTSKEGGVRVPAFLHYPEKVESYKKVESVISYVDIYATIKDLVSGIKENEDGISFLPTLNSNSSEIHDQRFLYISKTSVIQKNIKLNEGKLFDLSNDIKEKNNIIEKNKEQFILMSDTLNKFNTIIDKKITIDDSHKVSEEWKMIVE